MRTTRLPRMTPIAQPDPPDRPGPTFVHIQPPDNSPIQVLELPQGPIRVGRGAHCEVRLDNPKLGEVQCILRERGTAWTFQPVGPPGHVWIDGRPADTQGPVRMGIPFRVGDCWITLRSAENAFNDYGSFASPITIEPQAEVPPEPTPPPEPPRTPADDRLDRWQNRLDQRERWVKDRQDEKRWEARWKAAGETIRNKSTASPIPTPTPTPTPTPPPPRPPVSASAPRSRPAPPGLRPVSRIVEPRPLESRPVEPIRRAVEPTRPATTVRVRPAPPSKPVETPVATSRAIVCIPATMPPASLRKPASAEPPWESPTGRESIEFQPTEHLNQVPALGAEVDPVPSILAEVSLTVPEPVVAAPGYRRAEVTQPPAVETPQLDPPPSAATSPHDWPSARTIFEAQGTRSSPVDGPVAATKKRRATAPEPTEARPPDRWTLPLWAGWLPTTAFVLLMGGTGMGLSVEWVQEANAANLAILAATRPEGTAGPRLDPANIPKGGWWRSTAPHLSAWALAMARATDGEDHSEDLRMLIDGSRQASHLASHTRFLVEPPASDDPASGAGFTHLGRPREVLTLAWTGRRLRRAGKVEASIKAYRSAMEMAARVEPGNLESPAFVEDDKAQVRRYLFAHESLIRLVVRDMAESGDWTHEQWAATLPNFAVAPLAAAIEVRAKDRAESDRLLDLAIAQGEGLPSERVVPMEHLAATAEAMAIRGRWTDSSDRYRRAIDASDDDASRRMWWLNLAEVARRSNDDKLRARAIEAAKAPEAGDEITRRAIGLQQSLAAPNGSRAARP